MSPNIIDALTPLLSGFYF